MKIADLISSAIDRSHKSQRQIAGEAGFPKPNMITMIKQGKTRLPLCRVPAIARALYLDPRHLMDRCLNEYDPELREALAEVYDLPPLDDPSEVVQ